MQQLIKNLKNNKKQLFLIIAAIALLLVGGTVALLSAVTGTKVNAFDGGHVNVSVIETGGDKDNTDLENPSEGNVNNFNKVTTGQEVAKTVAIKNLDKEDYKTVDTYVRVRLVPCFRYTDGDYAGQIVPINMANRVSYNFAADNAEINGQWVSMETSGETYYYFNQAVAPGSVTDQLMSSVTINDMTGVPDNAHFELQVLTEGVAAGQKDADGKSSLEGAWGITNLASLTSVVTPETASVTE